MSGVGIGRIHSTHSTFNSRDFVIRKAAAASVAFFLCLAYHRPVAPSERFHNPIFRRSASRRISGSVVSSLLGVYAYGLHHI